jgi:hypothetical protein
MATAAPGESVAATAEVIAAATGRPFEPHVCMDCGAAVTCKSQRFCNEQCYGDLCSQLAAEGHSITPVQCINGEQCVKLATAGVTGLPVFGSQYGKQCWHCGRAANNSKQQAKRADMPSTGAGRGRPRKQPAAAADGAAAAVDQPEQQEAADQHRRGPRCQQQPGATAAAGACQAQWTRERLLALIDARTAGFGPKQQGTKQTWAAAQQPGSVLEGFSKDDLSKKWDALVGAAADDSKQEAVIRNKNRGGTDQQVTLGLEQLQAIRRQAARERG